MRDEQIVELYCRGDERAVAETQKRYARLCMMQARRIVGNEEDAEECFNDLLLCLWRTVKRDRPEKFGAYLMKMNRWLAISRYRELHSARHGGCVPWNEDAERLPGGVDPAAEAERRQQLAELSAAVSRLNGRARQIFLLYYLYGFGMKEIALRCNCPLGTVKSTLHRARERVRGELLRRETDSHDSVRTVSE